MIFDDFQQFSSIFDNFHQFLENFRQKIGVILKNQCHDQIFAEFSFF
jgi:hypothetical protein